MSGAVWFVGDLHFGHEKVAQIRGFDSTDAHDRALVQQWKRQVSDGDTVYVLGDLSSGSRLGEVWALSLLRGLPGYKRLIAGNHDSISSIHREQSPHTWEFREVFERIGDFGRVKVNQRQVMLSHYPYASQGDGPNRGPMRYAEYRLPDVGHPLIHAHTHHSDPYSGSRTGRGMCVSWDAWGRLVNLGDVARWLDGVPE